MTNKTCLLGIDWTLKLLKSNNHLTLKILKPIFSPQNFVTLKTFKRKIFFSTLYYFYPFIFNHYCKNMLILFNSDIRLTKIFWKNGPMKHNLSIPSKNFNSKKIIIVNPAIPFRDIFGHTEVTFLWNMVTWMITIYVHLIW